MSKALEVARLFHSEEIYAADLIPSVCDPKWVHITDNYPLWPSSSCKNVLVWAKDANDFIFKAFYFSGCRRIEGFWPAAPSLEDYQFGLVEYWMSYEIKESPK